MSQNSKARVAVVAAAALVGGLVPILAATTASAAEPTVLTVTPVAANAKSATDTTTFTVALNGSDFSKTVIADVISGPDEAVNPTCTAIVLGKSTCTVATPGTTAGIDSIRFFYDAAGTGTFQTIDPSATATITIGGVVNAVALTPASNHAAVAGYAAYTVSATDAQGRPVSGASVTVTAAQMLADGTAPVGAGALSVVATKPAVGAVKASGVGSASSPVLTSDGETAGETAGSGMVYIASDQAGTVALTVNGPTGVSATGSLVVSAADANDISSVAVSPATQNAFTGKVVQETITLMNAQGDLASGVTPTVAVTGANAGVTVTNLTGGVIDPTDGTGKTVVMYTTGTTTGTDTVQAYVAQTDNAVNTGGLDADEPRGSASVVVAADIIAVGGLTNEGSFNVPSDVSTAAVTFSLVTDEAVPAPAAGYNLSFTVTGTPTAGDYTLSQASGVTDANGQVTVNVMNAAPNAVDAATVTATVVGDTATTSDAAFNWIDRTSSIINTIAPAVDTEGSTGSVTHTVTSTDFFGDPVSGLTYAWSLGDGGRNDSSNNTGATGTGTSFTYADSGLATTSGSDTLTVTATRTVAGGGPDAAGTAIAKQYWVPGTALAAQVNIDLVAPQGTYTGPTFGAVGFQKSILNKSVATGSNTTLVSVRLADANGNPLNGESVSLTSSGVGGFVQMGGSLVNTVSVPVAESDGYATVSVRSSAAGTQTITAMVDGITDTATIDYTGEYVSIAPTRVADTRTGLGGLVTPAGAGVAANGRLVPNMLYTFDYTDAALPDASAYVFNVTAIGASGLGNLRVQPAGLVGVTPTSLVNYQVGEDVANAVIVPNDGTNALEVYSDTANAQVAIDLVGYYPTSTGITTVTPSRVVTTTPVAGGSHETFQITGKGGIPAGAGSVALNVTAIGPNGLGNMRVAPNGSPMPDTSNINYIAGQDKSAFVVIDLPANGRIDVYSDGGSANVAIDAFAHYAASANLVTNAPVRILDSRDGAQLEANTEMTIRVAGLAGVPVEAQAVLVSLTGISNTASTGLGNLTAYPAGGVRPVVSTLNYVSIGTDVANFAIVKLGTDGMITLYSDGSPIDAAVDVLGFVPAGQ